MDTLVPHKRTTHRSRPAKRLYAVREAKGRLTDTHTHDRITRHDHLRASKVEHRAEKR